MYQVVDEHPVQCGQCQSRNVGKTVNERHPWFVCLDCGHEERRHVAWTTAPEKMVIYRMSPESSVREF